MTQDFLQQKQDWRTAVFFLLSFTLYFFFTSSAASAAAYSTPVYDIATGDLATQTLTKANSPYVFFGGCTRNKVQPGATLTIEAGVVVKFGPPRYCFGGIAYSDLQVYGNLIVAGTSTDPVIFTAWEDDTAGGDTNGDASTTSPTPGAWKRLQLGGSSASSTVSIIGAEFRYGGPIEVNPYGKLNLTMDHLDIASSSSWGIMAFVPIEIHNSRFHDNHWGAIDADPVSGVFFPTVDATNNWWGDDSGPRVSSNPGGSGQAIRGNVQYDPWIGKPTTPDPVIVIPGILGSAEKNGEWVIDPIFHTYDDLIETLDVNGYTKEQDLFTFPYDWRASNVETAKLLELKIQKVKQICACAKVDIVAHSMGGLVARQYIQSDRYRQDVDQLIFLGTPHLGSPESYLTWEGGEMAPGIINGFIKFFLSREAKKAGYASLFDYVRQRPVYSIQELLPIFDYLRDKSNGQLRLYPDNYPKNVFLQNLYDTSSTLFNAGVRITNIVGDAGPASTISAFRVVPSSNLPLWENGYPEGYMEKNGDRGLEKANGDVTVPGISAESVRVDVNKVNSIHLELPSNAEGLIYKKLSNKDASVLIHHVPSINVPILIIKLLSPVDVQVIAPDGKRIGKDFATNQEINEIDGAFYSGFQTDNEYLTIPNPLDGEYRVITQGTDNGGAYTVATGYITDATSSEHDFTAQTVPGLMTEIHLDINQSAPEIVHVQPADITPPQINILSPTSTTYVRSVLIQLNVSVIDAESGVQSQEIAFDGILAHTGDAIDPFYQHLGVHTVSVSAADRVGNSANTSTAFTIIATIGSTISDIDRAFTLGWITRGQVKDQLLRMLGQAIRLEKRIELLEEQLPGRPKIIRRIERLEKRLNRLLGQAFLRELDKQHSRGAVNDAAYKLIQEDINWLLSH